MDAYQPDSKHCLSLSGKMTLTHKLSQLPLKTESSAISYTTSEPESQAWPLLSHLQCRSRTLLAIVQPSNFQLYYGNHSFCQ
ncbi:MAG: hypothetical protein SWJ54_13980, partial [Cyanobacteriota bacterium]|nr:hypothetical protein [Cyanobacteriota bacterium]